jgi:hypothetical protein
VPLKADGADGDVARFLCALSPMAAHGRPDEHRRMNSASHLQHRASELVEAARSFQGAAEAPASHAAAPDTLAALEEALQVLSASWYQLAADAAQGIAQEGLSREREAQLVGTLHDIAAAFASCARACRVGRSTAAPIIARRLTASQPDEGDARDDLAWFERREGPTQRVA